MPFSGNFRRYFYPYPEILAKNSTLQLKSILMHPTMKPLFLLWLPLLILASCSPRDILKYPGTRKVAVVDTFFGTLKTIIFKKCR
jgi:hypothetical protein